MSEMLDVLVFYVPRNATERVLAAVFSAGGGAIGDYEECAFVSPGIGRFRPVGGASPAIGRVGEVEHVEEDRVELAMPRRLRHEVVAAVRGAHPYEEPALHVIETATLDDP